MTAQPTMAADANGKFAIKGGGQQSCEKFETAMREKSTDIALYGGWIEGFITAQNQANENTFDIAPWQTTSTLLKLVQAVCKNQADETSFLSAFSSVYKLIFPSRLQEESRIMGVSNGEARAVAYQEILKRVQTVLRDQGYEIDEIDGFLDRAGIEQIMAYQRANNLVATGLPDQPTLYSLFFKK